MTKLTVLGSGTFFVNKDVSSSASVLEINNTKILIDCGPGTLVRLSEAGFDLNDIDYVFITHFHPDHTSDLFPLFMNFRLNDIFNEKKLEKFPTIYGPSNIDKFMLDMSHLTELHGYEGWDKIEVKAFEPELDLGDVKVKTFWGIHRPFKHDTEAYAIRVEAEGKVIAFSGDTGDCKGVRRACEEADLFLCDMSFPKTFKRDDIHMNSAEVGEICRDSNVKKVILNHLYPHFNDIDLVAEVKESFDGDVRKAVDLEVVEV